MARSLILILPVLTAALIPASEWPQFRGPNASGVSDETRLPVEFGPARNVVWKTAVPPGNSSPSVAGDKIFLTAFENDKLFTIALNRATGRILWRREAPRPRKQVIERPANGPVSGSPVSDGKRFQIDSSGSDNSANSGIRMAAVSRSKRLRRIR